MTMPRVPDLIQLEKKYEDEQDATIQSWKIHLYTAQDLYTLKNKLWRIQGSLLKLKICKQLQKRRRQINKFLSPANSTLRDDQKWLLKEVYYPRQYLPEEKPYIKKQDTTVQHQKNDKKGFSFWQFIHYPFGQKKKDEEEKKQEQVKGHEANQEVNVDEQQEELLSLIAMEIAYDKKGPNLSKKNN